MSRRLTDKEKNNLKKEIRKSIKNRSFTINNFANNSKIDRSTVRRLINNDEKLKKEYKKYLENNERTFKSSEPKKPFTTKEVEKNYKSTSVIVTTKSLNIRTVEDALKEAQVDMTIWEVDRHVINSWEVTVGAGNSGTGNPETYTNWQVKVWLKRKEEGVLALEELYNKIKTHSPIVPVIKPNIIKKKNIKRELEISLFDIHLGQRTFKPASDLDSTPESIEKLVIEILEKLIFLTKNFGPFERVVFPMGNDYLHTDNVYNTTTSNTPQPEADSWKMNFMRGELLGLAIIERLKKIAPVEIIVVPGNHARHTEIALGRIFNAYYHNDKNINVDGHLDIMSPYKFHSYGVNLIGFEHGHSIRQQVRLAALMANECRLNGWQEARYCEWHCGDQHRKGSGKPSMFEEQGVSIEFLPGLTVPNEWHRIHSFNWQKRGGMAFVWDKTAGPIARFQVNIDNYTGEIMI
jgi:hypothetical protein